jgi:uncharacterized damage-inducible protein DinB
MMRVGIRKPRVVEYLHHAGISHPGPVFPLVMMKRTSALAVALVCGTATAVAQGLAQADVLQQLRARWVASSEYTLAVAEHMPGDRYLFRPTPEQMTFGEQLLHIAEQNEMILREIWRLGPPGKKAAGHDKAYVVARLKETAALGLDLLAQQGKTSSSPELAAVLNGMMLALDHTTHHRGQAVVYLRLNGVTPPEYRR